MTEVGVAPQPLPVPSGDRPSHDPYQLYLDSLRSDESRRTMRGVLDRIVQMQTGDPNATGAWQPWWLLRYEHTTAIRAELLRRGYSPSHVNKHLIALRRVLRVCWRMGLMDADEYARAADLASLGVHRLPAGRNVHRDELAAMLTACACDGPPLSVRNAALIAVLYATGIRRAEAAGALVERYDPAERSLAIVGKRDKERLVYVGESAVPVLDRWLVTLGERRGAMFRPLHASGRIMPGHMSPRTVGYVVDRARRRAGLPPMSTHDLRRTHTGDLLDAGADLPTVQRMLGHASPKTTAAYDRRPNRAARAAADLLRLPAPGGDTPAQS